MSEPRGLITAMVRRGQRPGLGNRSNERSQWVDPDDGFGFGFSGFSGVGETSGDGFCVVGCAQTGRSAPPAWRTRRAMQPVRRRLRISSSRQAARADASRFLRAMLQLPARRRELVWLKLIERQDYAGSGGVWESRGTYSRRPSAAIARCCGRREARDEPFAGFHLSGDAAIQGMPFLRGRPAARGQFARPSGSGRG